MWRALSATQIVACNQQERSWKKCLLLHADRLEFIGQRTALHLLSLSAALDTYKPEQLKSVAELPSEASPYGSLDSPRRVLHRPLE
jgi:hypothetical protein